MELFHSLVAEHWHRPLLGVSQGIDVSYKTTLKIIVVWGASDGGRKQIHLLPVSVEDEDELWNTRAGGWVMCPRLRKALM